MSFNRWIYVAGNPINFSDPLGLCVNCYVYFFPGVGNPGDIDGDGLIETPNKEIGIGEKRLIDDLRSRTGAYVAVIFPYGPGLSSSYEGYKTVQDVAYEHSFIPAYKAQEIVARTLKLPITPCADDRFDTDPIDNNSSNITFIGYSGGGQIAYSTAQKLSGKLFVDNLVAFGSPIRLHDGLTNIGQFFSFMSEQDIILDSQGQIPLYWWAIEDQFSYKGYNSDKTTICSLFGDEQKPYVHFDPNGGSDYFGDTAMDRGRECVGKYYWRSVSREQASRDKLTRYEANLEWLIRIIEGTMG